MSKLQTDRFPNQAVIQVTESAPNTLTFKKLETGISLFEKIAWIIARVEYYVSSTLAAQFNADGDYEDIALTTTDQMTALALTNAAVIDYMSVHRQDYGVAASGGLITKPFVKDFTSLPGGGILVPPNPLYLGAKGTGLVAASTITAKFFYTTYELEKDEYWELVESRRIISS
jgi:hypothetical protein